MKSVNKLNILLNNIYYNSIVAFLLTIILGVIDWYSGFELSFQFFYFIPLALIAYNEVRSRGLILIGVIFVTFIWFYADYLSGHNYSSELMRLWNALSRFIVFIFFSMFLNAIVRNKLQLKNINSELFTKNRLIAESVEYAKRIQNSVIPDYKKLNEYFPQSFLISKPKNVLGGDFFWSYKTNNKLILVLADCTGHGVPGALLSIVGVILLNKVVVDKNIENPTDILKELNTELHKLFNAGNEMIEDGMEVCVVSYNILSKELVLAQTSDSIVIIEANGQVNDIQSDMISLGANFLYDTTQDFTKVSFNIEKGTTLFMFSDGITDQFGSAMNKKFGRQRLIKKLSEIYKLPASAQSDALQITFEEWKKDFQQTDDISIIGVTF